MQSKAHDRSQITIMYWPLFGLKSCQEGVYNSQDSTDLTLSKAKLCRDQQMVRLKIVKNTQSRMGRREIGLELVTVPLGPCMHKQKNK